MKNGVTVVKDDVAKLMESIRDLANVGDVLVGIPATENAREDSPIGNAAIGYINEFGSPAQGIPARPFLSVGVDAIKDKAAAIIGKGTAEALTSFDHSRITVAQNKAGLLAQNSVRAAITSGDGFEPLAASTIAARKRRGVTRTKPLIDTGSLRTSITYVIRKGGGDGAD